MKRNQLGFGIIAILMAVATASILVLAVYAVSRKSADDKPGNTSLGSSNDAYAEWQTFQGAGNEYSFKFPKGWQTTYNIGNQSQSLETAAVLPAKKETMFLVNKKLAGQPPEAYIEVSKGKPNTVYETADYSSKGEASKYHEIYVTGGAKYHKYAYWKGDLLVELMFTEYHPAYSKTEPAQNSSRFLKDFNLVAQSFTFQ